LLFVDDLVIPEENFLNNLIYPLILILVGGGISGGLIPWFTNRQKARESSLESLRKEREIVLENQRKENEIKIEHERQDYQFKIKLKHEILELFHDFRQNSFVALEEFRLKLSTYYSKGTQIDPNYPKLMFATFDIPDDPKKKPTQVFRKELLDLQSRVELKSEEYGNKFKTKIKWYSEDKDKLIAEFESLHEHTELLKTILFQLVESESTDDFSKISDKYQETKEGLLEWYDKFTQNLVNIKIKKIPV